MIQLKDILSNGNTTMIRDVPQQQEMLWLKLKMNT